MKSWKKIILGFTAAIVISYIILVIARIPVMMEKQKTVAQVAKIHATKLTLDDVMGKNLPGKPGAEADKTVQGIDANNNGIRDDVELAIFAAYPNSAKTRAVLLQYALALQMEMTQPIVNTETVVAVTQEISRANMCLGVNVSRDDLSKFTDITDGYINFVKNLQINNQERDLAESEFYKKMSSYADLPYGCDIDTTALPN